MSSHTEYYFKDQDIQNISGKTVILDIDGTIATDNSSDIEEAAMHKVRDLAEHNVVLLCSNKPNPARNLAISQKLNIPILTTHLRKPNKKIVDLIDPKHPKERVVIGDKMLTDGLFARNIDAEFVKVKRLKEHTDSFYTKLTYFLDDMTYHICKILKIV
ncbi:MAG: Mitochondrial phosphatase [Candidatus Parcubacteria bacterium]|jgi:predicted HAD superfamily phosphohydrolase YqeG